MTSSPADLHLPALVAACLLALFPAAAQAQQKTPSPARAGVTDTTATGTARADTTVTEKVIKPAVLDSVGLAQSSWAYRMDRQILLGVYDQQAWIFEDVMYAADRSAYPAFWGAVPAAWGLSLLRNDDYPAAYRLMATEALGAGALFLVKRVFGRIRPFIILRRVDSRSRWLTRESVITRKLYSFPSGHATTAFALATSLSLSFPRWYVIAPSMAWAASVATSRLWLGVHYPSDVIAGAVLGAAVATGVHLLRDVITPSFLEKGNAPGAPMQTKAPMLRLRLPLP